MSAELLPANIVQAIELDVERYRQKRLTAAEKRQNRTDPFLRKRRALYRDLAAQADIARRILKGEAISDLCAELGLITKQGLWDQLSLFLYLRFDLDSKEGTDAWRAFKRQPYTARLSPALAYYEATSPRS